MRRYVCRTRRWGRNVDGRCRGRLGAAAPDARRVIDRMTRITRPAGLRTRETRVGIVTDAAAAPDPGRRVVDRVCRANRTAGLRTRETGVGIVTDSTATPNPGRR